MDILDNDMTWKELIKEIKKAKKDPQFRKELRQFIRVTTSQNPYLVLKSEYFQKLGCQKPSLTQICLKAFNAGLLNIVFESSETTISNL